MFWSTFSYDLTTFLDSRAEICQIFQGFLENLKFPKDILKLSDLYRRKFRVLNIGVFNDLLILMLCELISRIFQLLLVP